MRRDAFDQELEVLLTTLEAAGIALWDWDLTRNAVIWNQVHYTLLGIPEDPGAITPNYFLQFVHPDDR